MYPEKGTKKFSLNFFVRVDAPRSMNPRRIPKNGLLKQGVFALSTDYRPSERRSAIQKVPLGIILSQYTGVFCL